MSLRRDHGSDNQLWISYVKTLGQSRNWVPRSSLFRRWDEQSRAEAIFAKKASIPQKRGDVTHFCTCVIVFWGSVGSIAYLLLALSVCCWKQYILLEASRLIVSGTDFYFLGGDVLS